jgi:hypothetical protein
MHQEKLKVVSITALLFTFLYTGASFNAFMHEASIYARYLFLAIAVSTSIVVFMKTKTVSRSAHYYTLCILIFGILHFPMSQLPPSFGDQLLKEVFQCILVIFVTYLCSGAQFTSKIKIYDLAIVLVVLYLAVIIIGSSIKFAGFLPVLHFSLIPGELKISSYSQGVTRIFAVAVLAIVFKVSNERMPKLLSLVLIFLSLCFFVLALAGGARGEVVVCVIVLIFIVCKNWKSIPISILILSLFFAVSQIPGIVEILTKLPAVWRLLVAYQENSLAQRDVLLFESLLLLSENPRCFLFGCGLGFFQQYYNYDYGEYPHNWIAETVISFGGPLLVLFMFIVGYHLLKRYRYFGKNEKFLLLLSLYFFGLALKSGSMLAALPLYSSFLPLLYFTRRPQTSYDVEPNLSVRPET